jgi:hypothetical protein
MTHIKSQKETVVDNEYHEQINQDILKKKIEYSQKMLRKAIINYNNLIEAHVLKNDYTVECYDMEIEIWTRQLDLLQNRK